MEIWQWVVAGLGAFLVGVSKTGIAGLGTLSVVLFASALPTRESVGVALIVLIAADLVAVTVYRRDADWSQLGRLFPWAALGVGLGALAFGQVSDRLARILIGGIVVLLVVMHVLRQRRPADESGATPPLWRSALTGVMAGVTTMIANAAGPLMVIYLLGMGLPKLTFLGTAAWFFLVINLFKLPFSYGLGLITWSSIGLSLSLAPLAMLGALLGRQLITRIDQQVFEQAALGLTLLAGLRLLLV